MNDNTGGPNGGAILIPSDPTTLADCWVSSTTTPNMAKYAADTTQSIYFEAFVIAACAGVNKICHRYFNQQQFDQIFPNDVLWVRDYKAYPLSNRPLISVDNVWLQIVNTWAPVASAYWQLLPQEGVIKILPTFNPYALVTLPSYFWPVTTNVWVRYTSGFTTVPAPVVMATALYVDYLFSRSNLIGGVSEAKTQTTDTTYAIGENDPVYAAITTLLKPYIFNQVL